MDKLQKLLNFMILPVITHFYVFLKIKGLLFDACRPLIYSPLDFHITTVTFAFNLQRHNNWVKNFIIKTFIFFSNTLETMSARSFGFIKPSQKFRDNDMANRIRRHQSFFNADTSSITGESHEKNEPFLGKTSWWAPTATFKSTF